MKPITWRPGSNGDTLKSNLLAAAEAFPSADGRLEGFPLEGGISWISMLGRLMKAFGLVAGLVGIG